MACQVWNKNGEVVHVDIEEMERGIASGEYRTTEEAEPEQPKRGRKAKAVENED